MLFCQLIFKSIKFTGFVQLARRKVNVKIPLTFMPLVNYYFRLALTQQRVITGNGFFSIPEHTPLIFSESSGTGRTLFRLLVSDSSGENEGYLLAETVPFWAVDVTVKVSKSDELSFDPFS